MKESLQGGIDGAQLGPSKLDDPLKNIYMYVFGCARS